MSNTYFSDRERGPRRRVEEEITQTGWGGLLVLIQSRGSDGSFGYRYPLQCPDGQGPYGCHWSSFETAIKGEIPDIELPMVAENVPTTLCILDVLEFCHRVVAMPIPRGYHPFYGHDHISFNPEAGQEEFRSDVNRILARNGLSYELKEDGSVVRLASPVLHDVLNSAEFKTGDAELDALLSASVGKYLDPDPGIRRESLEKLWDAWERLKTLEYPEDKKQSVQVLLQQAAEKEFLTVLETEAKQLTDIGNSFSIRHSEITQNRIDRSEHIDYLFHRLFALIQLLLRATGRGK
ncbi:MAG: hypothetical protein HY330_00655 [Chloroflexi bacterium]|nr:hypothetical protein [Chloroflexota bacterium]